MRIKLDNNKRQELMILCESLKDEIQEELIAKAMKRQFNNLWFGRDRLQAVRFLKETTDIQFCAYKWYDIVIIDEIHNILHSGFADEIWLNSDEFYVLFGGKE